MVNGGPLFGINGIVRFETGTAYDAEYGAEYTTCLLYTSRCV